MEKKDALENNHVPIITVNMAADYYSAEISIDLHQEAKEISKELILEKLKEKNITVGIDMEKLEAICQNPTSIRNTEIAKGRPHQNGNDGEILYKVDIDYQAKPKVLEDGTVDFKEMGTFLVVKSGQVLAEKIDPTEGEDGLTVTGKIIKGKKGKIINFKFGKNIVLSEDGMKIVSEKDGALQVEGEKLSVIEVLEIQGDVGIETGNVQFKGKVVVSGNVITGYEIHCDGDLEIQGVVEGAKICSKGDVTIGRGIQGQDEAEIGCGGNLVSNFISNCSVKVQGDIQADAVMHAEIICDGIVQVMGRKGLIVGGSIRAKEEIRAKVIGSDMGTQTRLFLGIDSELIEQYKTFSEKIKEIKDNIKKLDQAINLLNRQVEADPQNQANVAMLKKTRLSKAEYSNDLAQNATEFRELQQRIDKLQGSKIVANEIYPGTKITIGQSHYNVKELLKNPEIGKYDGEIRTSKL